MKRYPLNPPITRPGVSLAKLRKGGDPVRPAPRLPFGDEMPHAEQLVALAEKIRESRGLRQKFLAVELFAEPGWEMLLALYRADAAGVRMSVSNLCRITGGPETTAVRWIDRLEDLEMISRRRNPLDRRVYFVELSPETRNRIQDYLVETWTSMSEALTSGTHEK